MSETKAYTCPSCGSPINFRSPVSIYTTCEQCQSNVVRHDMDLELLGKQSLQIRDMSPFQIGTSGVYDGKRFELLGRLKVMYDKGTWSEWFVMFEDGEQGWLAEAQGFYMMSFEETLEDGLPNPKSLKVGGSFKIRKQKFEIDDIQDITYAASEGELPFPLNQGYKGKSVDLRGPKNSFATLLYDKDGGQIFLGQYREFEEFEFNNLKEIDGW